MTADLGTFLLALPISSFVCVVDAFGPQPGGPETNTGCVVPGGVSTLIHMITFDVNVPVAKHQFDVQLVASPPSVPWVTQPPYSGDCLTRPPGTVCLGFSDGYVWLITGSVSGWETFVADGLTIQAAISGTRRYEHILGTHQVRVVDT